ncbi:MAG: phosphate ABC transporter permease PstA [Actinobacteria bacterium]|nr:MAG: phosphate ABC transporter permease PstA [Actinomycetota bacterium]
MTTLTTPTISSALHVRRLPAWAIGVTAAGAVALSVALFSGLGLLGGGPVLTAVGAVVLFLVGLSVVSTVVEGGRAARNRVATALVYSAFVLALLPLVSVVATLFGKGTGRLDADFFNHSMRNITAFDANGGAYHAIIGTLEQAGIATLITVPLGVLGAIYIVEYGRGAGLFILAFWILIVSPHLSPNGRPFYSGFAASLALSVLMLPTVTRSTEEMLRLVPAALREGSYALGVPKWKTILRIVLPTALPGIVTGVMLAVARAAGETAPVLLVALGSPRINFDPFHDPQESLSVYIYDQATSASRYAPARAWTAALTLVALVLTLTVAAKLLSRRNTLNKGK